MSTDDEATVTEQITPGPALALADLLAVPAPDLDREPLPLLWHWLYLQAWAPVGSLGPDGHPAGGIPHPPQPGMSRMFAGGRVRGLAGLRVGDRARRTTRILRTVEKEGRSGPLTFVTVETTIDQNGRTALVEEQDIMYRPRSGPATGGTRPSTPAGPPETPPAPGGSGVPEGSGVPGESVAPGGPVAPDGGETFRVDAVTLFRLSALTFNSHRIHFDVDYARRVEGYPDLVVHGPLHALLMSWRARRMSGPRGLTAFDYRLTAPLFGPQTLRVAVAAEGAAIGTRVYGANGSLAASGVGYR